MDEFQTVAEKKPEESCIAGIDDTKSVFTTSYGQTRPCFAVDDNYITKILWLPLRVYRGIISCGTHVYRTISEKATIEHHQRPIEFITTRQSKWGLNITITDNVGPNQAS
jgi:hypothetical protein